MRGLHNRVRRLERGARSDLSVLTDAELNRRMAEILASVPGKPVEEPTKADKRLNDDTPTGGR